MSADIRTLRFDSYPYVDLPARSDSTNMSTSWSLASSIAPPSPLPESKTLEPNMRRSA